MHSIWAEILHFLVHLRWHYQLFILSGGFLLGGFMSAGMNWQSFLIQFANVHLLLFGGATAYNSYWDKDEGPVGGLKHPPNMRPWMRPVSFLVQIGGLWLAVRGGILFVTVYLMSMILFWLYSTPLFRWKGSPVKSLIAIGLSTGANSVLLGYLAAGNISLNKYALLAAIGVMLIILSLYPVSQLYQTDDDAKRGDRTFAVEYGKSGMIKLFSTFFPIGMLLIAVVLLPYKIRLALFFLIIAGLTGFTVVRALKSLTLSRKEYRKVMRVKYGTSLAFCCFFIVLLLFKHGFS